MVTFWIWIPFALLPLPGILPYLACIVLHDVEGGNWPRTSPPDQQMPLPPPTRTGTLVPWSTRNCAVVASTLALPARLPVSYVEVRSPLNVTSEPACVRHEPAGGGGGVVTVMVDVPLLPSLVAVIVADPTATPATSPLPFTPAIDDGLVAHVIVRPVSVLPFASLGEAVSWVVCPTNTEAVAGLTVTDATGTGAAVTVTADVPLCPSDVAVIVVEPATTPVTRPLALTVPTGGVAARPRDRAARERVAVRILRRGGELDRLPGLHRCGRRAHRHRCDRYQRDRNHRRTALSFGRRGDRRRAGHDARHQPAPVDPPDRAIAARPGDRAATQGITIRVLRGGGQLHRLPNRNRCGRRAHRHRRHRHGHRSDRQGRRAAVPFGRRRDRGRARRRRRRDTTRVHVRHRLIA